jgi:hypothetical protein
MLPSLKGKHVHFSLSPTIIYEPDDITEDLREYRKNNDLQKKADMARYTKLLTPILTLDHRRKIWTKLLHDQISDGNYFYNNAGSS